MDGRSGWRGAVLTRGGERDGEVRASLGKGKMKTFNSLRFPVAATSIALIVVACAQPSQNDAPDRDLVTLLHTLIVGTVTGGGISPNEVFVPADSTSASIMRVAEVPIHEPTKLNCPGGTEANGELVRGRSDTSSICRLQARATLASCLSTNHAPSSIEVKSTGFFRALTSKSSARMPTGVWPA